MSTSARRKSTSEGIGATQTGKASPSEIAELQQLAHDALEAFVGPGRGETGADAHQGKRKREDGHCNDMAQSRVRVHLPGTLF